jgi:hypothetical protein
MHITGMFLPLLRIADLEPMGLHPTEQSGATISAQCHVDCRRLLLACFQQYCASTVVNDGELCCHSARMQPELDVQASPVIALSLGYMCD